MLAGRAGVVSDLASYRRGAPPQLLGYLARGAPGARRVGDLDALLQGKVVAVHPLRFFHAPRIPVDERPLVAAGQPGAPVPPDLAGSLGDADSPRGLREAHALPEVLEIALAPGPLHVAKLLVGDTLELARHFQHPSFPRVLHSSLESAVMVFPSGALFFGPLILARYN